MPICFRCGKPIKVFVTHYDAPLLLERLGRRPRLFHPHCFEECRIDLEREDREERENREELERSRLREAGHPK